MNFDASNLQGPSSMTPIEFVYFDLGNVLAKFDVQRACENVASRWNLDPAKVRASLWHSGTQDLFEHGHIDEEAFAQVARDALQLHSDHSPTLDLLNLLSDMFEPIREMESVVDEVREHGTKVGILSNTCIAHWRWLLQNDYPALQKPFDRIVLSYEEGVMKPNPQIYHLAQIQAGVPPDRILFFDDRIDNIEAAVACRWQAYQFTDAETARKVLRYHRVIT